MRRILLIICLMILTGACTFTQPAKDDWWRVMSEAITSASKSAWYSPIATLEECERDFEQCRAKAADSIYSPFSSEFSQITRRIDYCAACMITKGYSIQSTTELPSWVRLSDTPYGGWLLAGE